MVVFVAALGLVGGYLEVALIVLRRYLWNGLRIYENGADFPWTVPLGHVLLLAVPGLLAAAVNRARPRPIPPRVLAWLFTTLALWLALLRLPLYGPCSLLLAAGLGRWIGGGIAEHLGRPARARATIAGLAGLLILFAAGTTGRDLLRERRAVAGLVPPRAGAPNVLMIVWDTVRAGDLGLYGYPRATTPNLARRARQGVRFDLALATAPWTYPSHASMFTGRWPFELDAGWTFPMNESVPTLAGYLAARGYQTAGFSANTACCSYETGLDRDFAHFEDYPLGPGSFLSRTAAGNAIVRHVLAWGDYGRARWLRFQSRDAAAINEAFLDWLGQRRPDRPFFAFLNHFDAHEPYVPPAGYAGRFGIRPRPPRDYEYLMEYGRPGLRSLAIRDIRMARDCYDDCIAYLDERLGRLLDELESRGILRDTLVIITSDHGESFGDHGTFLHPTSVYLDELAVPLVILGPGVPAGRVVEEPVTLRDLPATVADRLGLTDGCPFPGRPLARAWSAAPGASRPEGSPVLSEYVNPAAVRPTDGDEPGRQGVLMSLAARGRHYIRDGEGHEQLYDVARDRLEIRNLLDSEEGEQLAHDYRRMLLEAMEANPGSAAAEEGYLEPYRRRLRSLVDEGDGPPGAMTAQRDPADRRRSEAIRAPERRGRG